MAVVRAAAGWLLGGGEGNFTARGSNHEREDVSMSTLTMARTLRRVASLTRPRRLLWAKIVER